jgi:hypothetical protein
MGTKTGAEASFKGYSSQTLYILHRVLTDTRNLMFFPERAEDLSVYDEDGKHIEEVQVKDLSSNFGLNDFGDDFFNNRLPKYLKEKIPITLLSFGKVGPELKNANNGVEKDKQKVIKKLIDNKKFSSKESELFLTLLNIQEVSHKILRDKINENLLSTSAALNDKYAYDLLTQWIYKASEKKGQLSRQEIYDKLLDTIVSYNEAHSHLKILGHNVKRIFEDSLLKTDEIIENKDFYEEQFLLGMNVRKEHILADVDVKRFDKLEEINNSFDKSSIVVVHGASGQGKSCLAYRYLFDCSAAPFEVVDYSSDNIDDIIKTFKNLANQNINIQIPLYIDVLPGQSEWIKIIKNLSSYPKQFKILVTIREEEWNSTPIEKHSVQFEEISLGFDKKEAQYIFERIEKQRKLPNEPIFEGAWKKFGETGPLLEFVYLLNQGSTLKDRLESQIKALNNKEKELLRLISFAGQFSSTINTKKLFSKYKDFNDFTFNDIIKRFNNEHLLRLDSGEISPIHPIRAKIICDLLTFETTEIDRLAICCLDVISETAYELFLKNVFYSFDFEEALTTNLKERQFYTWSGITGVVRALLWLGIRNYVNNNKKTIEEVKDAFGSGWQLILAKDFMGISDLGSGLVDTFGKNNPELHKKAIEWKNELAPANDVFLQAKNFLTNSNGLPTVKIKTANEIEKLGQLLYWLGFLDCKKEIDIKTIVDFTLPTKSVAYLFKGLFHYSVDLFQLFISDRAAIVKRFQEERGIVFIEENTSEVITHIINSHNIGAPEGVNDVSHWLTMDLLGTIHLLYPEKEFYCSKPYGFDFEYIGLNDQSVTKRIPKENMRFEWDTYVNSHFYGIGNESSRPANWNQYFLDLAKTFETCRKIQSALIEVTTSYINKDKVDYKSKLNRLNIEASDIITPHLFPLETVDKFGGFTETTDMKNVDFTGTSIAIDIHLPLKDAVGSFLTSLNNAFTQMIKVLVCITSNNRNAEDYKQLNKWCSYNLAKTITEFEELNKILNLKYSKYNQSLNDYLSQDDSIRLLAQYNVILKKKKTTHHELDRVLNKESNIVSKLTDRIFRQLKNKQINVDVTMLSDKRCVIVGDTEDILKFHTIFEIITEKIKHIIGQHSQTSVRRIYLRNEINKFIIIPLYKSKQPMKSLVFSIDVDTLFDIDLTKLNPIFYFDLNGVPKDIELKEWASNYEILGKIEESFAKFGELQGTVNRFSQMVSLDSIIPDDGFEDKILDKELEDSVQYMPVQKCIDIIEELSSLLNNSEIIDGMYLMFETNLAELNEKKLELLPPNTVKDGDERKASFGIKDFSIWASNLNSVIPDIQLTLMLTMTKILAMYENDKDYRDTIPLMEKIDYEELSDV